jgi:hypothetical protein
MRTPEEIQAEIDTILEANTIEWRVLGTEVLPANDRQRRLSCIERNTQRLKGLLRQKWQLEPKGTK